MKFLSLTLSLSLGLALVNLAAHETAAPEKAKASCCPVAPAPEAKPEAGYSANSIYQLDATYTDDDGRPFALGQLRGRPVLIAMFFSSCTYACPLLVSDLTRIRAALPEPVRSEAAIVLVSFDVERDTPAALKQFRATREIDAQWTLLHGDAAAVRELAALLGVKYKQESNGQFAHSNLITVLNTAGEIVHQRVGLTGGHAETAHALAIAR